MMKRFLLACFVLAPVVAGAQPAPLRIALFASFPPMAYKVPETNKLAGVDVDLADYVGRKLNRPVIWQDVSYEQAIPALTTGRVDLAFSLLDEPASRDKLDYIDYLKSGVQAYTLTSHAPVASLLELCGQKLGANRRNGFADRMREWSAANCVSAGKPPITVENTDGTQAARLQLGQGRVDAIVQSSESVPYTFNQEPGRYVRIDKPLAALSIAIAFPKASTALRDQVAAALRDAVADGTYAAALAKHGLTDNSAAADIAATASKP
ncbi:transporter substrate-binding domain-containing protein [Terrarubrum flagellatum]|uniref:transporter substrate-binding domain-containing protein n=1 Tax=Terrirubrum flagellatum TaxID=2895980 RepID=UPI0031455F48